MHVNHPPQQKWNEMDTASVDWGFLNCEKSDTKLCLYLSGIVRNQDGHRQNPMVWNLILSIINYLMVYFVWENRQFHTHIAILGWSPVGSLDRWMVRETSDDSDDDMLSP